jgi:hypothetical protein
MSTATDATLIALGERFEKLLLEHMDAWLTWAPRMRAARAEVKDNTASLAVAIQRTGCDMVQARMSEIERDMQPLAEEMPRRQRPSVASERKRSWPCGRHIRPTPPMRVLLNFAMTDHGRCSRRSLSCRALARWCASSRPGSRPMWSSITRAPVQLGIPRRGSEWSRSPPWPPLPKECRRRYDEFADQLNC